MLFVVMKYGPKPSTKHQRGSRLRRFHQSKGYRRATITTEWLEDILALRVGVTAMEANSPEFQRTMRGLNILFDGLQQQTGLTGCSAQTELIGFICYFVSAGK